MFVFRRVDRAALTLSVSILAAGAGPVRGQEQPAAPAIPSPPLPSANPSRPPVPPSEPSWEDRLRKLEARYEAMDRQHRAQYDALLKKYEALQRQVSAGMSGADPPDPPDDSLVGGGVGAQGTGGRTSVREVDEATGTTPTAGARGGEAPPGGAGGPSRRARGGLGAQGAEGRPFIREQLAEGEEKPPRRLARVYLSEGLQITTPNDEFQITFHDLTQLDYRGFPKPIQGFLKSQFFIPRQRWYFTGRVTRHVEYYTVINRGYGSLDLLDAFITFSYDDRLRVRAGRMKTPYLYEYYSIAEGDLIAPERSLYTGNLADNRQEGVMALGNLFADRVGYALGVFNGPRRSFQDFNSDKDLFVYLNVRPFLLSERFPALHYLNLTGSVNGGYENNPLAQPGGFHTANDQTVESTTIQSLSPTFLLLNKNVTETGQRYQWSADLSYFYKSLTLLAYVAGGSIPYAFNNEPPNIGVPVHGWMVQGSYFLTGEHTTRRVNVVKPRHNFSLKPGAFRPGAIEVHARYSEIGLGRTIFTRGFADPNLWANQAQAVDVGLNWYWNFYTKIYFDWQHALFNQPVTTGNADKLMRASDLFWLRFQVFF